ncbi:hypothetical protein EDB19DRAFT_1827313 [Suillus lakei]|nr:hypothetical protein EDB19DRAFT_1827313 [Suillus lakei]
MYPSEGAHSAVEKQRGPLGRLATSKFQLKAKIPKAWESFCCLAVINSLLFARLFTRPKIHTRMTGTCIPAKLNQLLSMGQDAGYTSHRVQNRKGSIPTVNQILIAMVH